jgi:phosphoribosylformylglycinamidine synthase
MKVKLIVFYKRGVFDPQGKAIKHSVESLGFKGIKSVRMGKYFEVELDAKNKKEAYKRINRIAKALLANPVIEDWKILE